MKVFDTEINPLGMGCWPIGGPFYAGDVPLGYANSDDRESIRTIHAALANGMTLFDTAAAYGCGHAERLLALALKNRPDALVVTKIGLQIDEARKQLLGNETAPHSILPAIDRCLARLERDHIDLLFLHPNTIPLVEAEAVFNEMEKAIEAGKIRSYGWSTDFTTNVRAFADRPNFAAVQHALNVLTNPPAIQNTVRDAGLTALIRSPLAMGLLSGKYGADAVIPRDDIRGAKVRRTNYYTDAKSNPNMLAKLDAVRELLTIDGRTLVQGALSWLWARGENNIPIPGARTAEQFEGLAGALAYGPLPATAMAEIETLIDRSEDEGPDRER